MIGVVIRGKTPKEFLKSVEMLNGAGFAPSRLTLGRAFYLLPDAGTLSGLRSVSVPAETLEKVFAAEVSGADALEMLVAA